MSDLLECSQEKDSEGRVEETGKTIKKGGVSPGDQLQPDPTGCSEV